VADHYSRRQYTIRIIFAVVAAGLIFRTFYIQLIDATYRAKAEATTIDRQVTYPSRGVVYDRNGKLLVFNDPSYDLMATYNQIDPEMDTMAFCELLDITKAEFIKGLDKNWRSSRFSKSVPFPFLTNISAERFAQFEERLYQFPGFRPLLRHTRGYPHRNGAHLLGYTREVSKDDIKRSGKVYNPGDYIGKSGLELAYEDTLRGEKGVKLILKDNLGRDVDAYKGGELDKDPISGKDMISSIDLDLQAYGEQLMQNKIGSIVAIDPRDGEILAMVSTPTYDPNLLAIGKGNKNAYAGLVNAPNNILFDRSIMAQYPPGSLFKPIVALIGLQTGVLNPDRTIYCSGAYFFEGMRLTGCHGHPTCFDVSMGIQHSCNAYFVTVFRDIVDSEGGVHNPEAGLDVFNSYLSKFGLGSQLGIDLPREKPGNFPTSKFYTDYFNKQQEGQRWNSIWIRSLGIGQGELLMTNLQMANVAAIIANRGYYYTPHLVKGIIGNNIGVPEQFVIRHEVGIDAEHFEPVIDGMEQVALAGTARSAYIPGIPICGKTGTAENPHGKDHSIFFAFAPKDDPQIAIAVYVENAGFGGTYAAPIASMIVEKHINDSIHVSRKWLEQRMMDANLMPEKP
jgi:penicillin-binding protein 2